MVIHIPTWEEYRISGFNDFAAFCRTCGLGAKSDRSPEQALRKAEKFHGISPLDTGNSTT